MNSLFSVKEKVILLTGGYGILGACMAKHLAREGAYVVILGRNEQKGSALVGEIKAEGGEALFLVSNVLDKALLEQNKQEILKAYGKIDVLVNLAGGNQAGATIPPDKTIFDLDIDAFRTVVDLNLFGTVLPTMVFAEVMVGQGKGSIINISSESSLRPLTRVVGYGCAKAAINNGYDMDIKNAVEYEANLFGITCSTHDKTEGMTAFLEKRKEKNFTDF